MKKESFNKRQLEYNYVKRKINCLRTTDNSKYKLNKIMFRVFHHVINSSLLIQTQFKKKTFSLSCGLLISVKNIF